MTTTLVILRPLQHRQAKLQTSRRNAGLSIPTNVKHRLRRGPVSKHVLGALLRTFPLKRRCRSRTCRKGLRLRERPMRPKTTDYCDVRFAKANVKNPSGMSSDTMAHKMFMTRGSGAGSQPSLAKPLKSGVLSTITPKLPTKAPAPYHKNRCLGYQEATATSWILLCCCCKLECFFNKSSILFGVYVKGASFLETFTYNLLQKMCCIVSQAQGRLGWIKRALGAGSRVYSTPQQPQLASTTL